MDNPNPHRETPDETAKRVAQTYFGVGPDPAARRSAIQAFLAGTVWSAVLIPLIFYLRFGQVGGLGWGTTIFFVMYCLLSAIGLYFGPRAEYHTPVRPRPLNQRGDWLDWVGAFWLVSCVFGPFLGWVITAVFPLTADSWRWLYGLRLILAGGLPLITALPLVRYLRGKAVWVALPILVVVTLLPLLSVVNVSRDLWEGPVVRQVPSTGQMELYLPHTQRSLDVINVNTLQGRAIELTLF